MEPAVLDAAMKLAASLPDAMGHTVAAAAMDAGGAIYTGVGAGHLTGGPCAEMVVLGAAAAEAVPLITMVAAGAGGQGILPPCGRCRQTLTESFPDIGILMPTWPGEDGPTRVRVSSLLPGAAARPGLSSGPRVVHFAAQYFEDVLAGRKTSTLRFNDPTAIGPVTLLFEYDDGPRTLSGVVTGIRRASMRRLMDEHDCAEGQGAGDRLLVALRRHYPGLTPASQMEHVCFRCAAA